MPFWDICFVEFYFPLVIGVGSEQRRTGLFVCFAPASSLPNYSWTLRGDDSSFRLRLQPCDTCDCPARRRHQPGCDKPGGRRGHDWMGQAVPAASVAHAPGQELCRIDPSDRLEAHHPHWACCECSNRRSGGPGLGSSDFHGALFSV